MNFLERDIENVPGTVSYWMINWSRKTIGQIDHPEDSRIRPWQPNNERISPEMIDFLGLRKFPQVRTHTKIRRTWALYQYRYKNELHWVKTTIAIFRKDYQTYISGLTGVFNENDPPTERYKSVFKHEFNYIKNMQFPAVMVNRFGELMMANPRFNVELKRRAVKWFGKPLSLILQPESEKVIFDKKIAQNYFAKTTIDGEEHRYHVTSAPFKFNSSLYHMVYATNLKAEVGVENAMTDMTKQLDKLIKLKDDVVSKTTHDFNAPINRILGLTEIMEAELSDPEQLEYIQMIRICARQLACSTQVMMEAINEEEMNVMPFREHSMLEIMNELNPSIESRASKFGLEYHFKALPIESKIVADINLTRECINIAAEQAINSSDGPVAIQIAQPNKFEVVVTILNRAADLPEDYKIIKKERYKRSNIRIERMSLSQVDKYMMFMGGELDLMKRKSGGNAIYLRFSTGISSDS